MKEDNNYKNLHNVDGGESINIKNISEGLNQFIKIIDIDNLSPEDLVRILVAVGSKNMAYYLALIVNLENRSRKISPLAITKILSSTPAKDQVYVEMLITKPNSNPVKASFSNEAISKNNNEFNKV